MNPNRQARIERVLNEADISTPASTLEYALAQLSQLAVHDVPVALQSTLAEIWAGEHREAGLQALRRHPNAPDLKSWQDTYTAFPELYGQVSGQRLSTDLSMLTGQTIKGTDQTLGQRFPFLKNITTVGQLGDALYGMSFDTVAAAARKAHGSALSVTDAVGEATVAFYTKGPFYNRWFKDDGRATDFVTYMNKRLFGSVVGARRDEQRAQRDAGLTASQFGGLMSGTGQGEYNAEAMGWTDGAPDGFDTPPVSLVADPSGNFQTYQRNQQAKLFNPIMAVYEGDRAPALVVRQPQGELKPYDVIIGLRSDSVNDRRGLEREVFNASDPATQLQYDLAEAYEAGLPIQLTVNRPKGRFDASRLLSGDLTGVKDWETFTLTLQGTYNPKRLADERLQERNIFGRTALAMDPDLHGGTWGTDPRTGQRVYRGDNQQTLYSTTLWTTNGITETQNTTVYQPYRKGLKGALRPLDTEVLTSEETAALQNSPAFREATARTQAEMLSSAAQNKAAQMGIDSPWEIAYRAEEGTTERKVGRILQDGELGDFTTKPDTEHSYPVYMNRADMEWMETNFERAKAIRADIQAKKPVPAQDMAFYQKFEQVRRYGLRDVHRNVRGINHAGDEVADIDRFDAYANMPADQFYTQHYDEIDLLLGNMDTGGERVGAGYASMKTLTDHVSEAIGMPADSWYVTKEKNGSLRVRPRWKRTGGRRRAQAVPQEVFDRVNGMDVEGFFRDLATSGEAVYEDMGDYQVQQMENAETILDGDSLAWRLGEDVNKKHVEVMTEAERAASTQMWNTLSDRRDPASLRARQQYVNNAYNRLSQEDPAAAFRTRFIGGDEERFRQRLAEVNEGTGLDLAYNGDPLDFAYRWQSLARESPAVAQRYQRIFPTMDEQEASLRARFGSTVGTGGDAPTNPQLKSGVYDTRRRQARRERNERLRSRRSQRVQFDGISAGPAGETNYAGYTENTPPATTPIQDLAGTHPIKPVPNVRDKVEPPADDGPPKTATREQLDALKARLDREGRAQTRAGRSASDNPQDAEDRAALRRERGMAAGETVPAPARVKASSETASGRSHQPRPNQTPAPARPSGVGSPPPPIPPDDPGEPPEMPPFDPNQDQNGLPVLPEGGRTVPAQSRPNDPSPSAVPMAGGGSNGRGNGNKPPTAAPAAPPPPGNNGRTPTPASGSNVGEAQGSFAVNQQISRWAQRNRQGSATPIPSNTVNAIGQQVTGTNFAGQLSRWHHPIFGNFGKVGDNIGFFSADGEQTMSTEMATYGLATGQHALNQAHMGGLPGDINSAVATLRQRAMDAVYKQIKQIGDVLEKRGMPQTEVQENVQKIEAVAKKVVDTGLERSANRLEVLTGQDSRGTVARAIQYDASKISTKEQAAELETRHRGIGRQFFDENGMTMEQALAQGESRAIVSGDNAYYLSAGDTPSANRAYTPRAQNRFRFGGPAGSLLFGMWMAQTSMRMTVQPGMEAAGWYGAQAAGIGAVGALGGGGMSLAGASRGFEGEGQMYAARAAYDMYAPFRQMPYLMSQIDPSGGLGRFAEYGKMALGSGMALGIGGATLPMMMGMTEASVAIGGGMMTAAPILAGGLLAAGGIAELHNAFTPDWGDWTPNNLYNQTVDTANLWGARWGLPKGDYRSVFQLNSAVKKYYAGGQLSATEQKYFDALSDENKARLDMARKGFSTDVERITGDNNAWAKLFGLSPEQTWGLTQGMEQVFGSLSYDEKKALSDAAFQRGVGGEQSLQQGMSYAEAMGAPVGSSRHSTYARQVMASPSVSQVDRLLERAGKGRGLYSQAAAQMGMNVSSAAAARMFYGFGYQTQQHVTQWSQAVAAAQSGGAVLTEGENTLMAAAFRNLNPLVASTISDIGSLYAQNLGPSFAPMMQMAMSSASPQDARWANAILSGDLRGSSYYSWTQGGGYATRSHTAGGTPIQNVSGTHFYRYLLANQGNFANTQGVSFLSGQKFAESLLGTTNPEIVNAFQQGGYNQLSRLSNQKSYEAQMGSIGVQLKGIALQEKFYWGSGSWDNPGQGSSWYIEDRMTALNRRSQAQDFAVSSMRMERQNQFSLAQENLSLQRMNISSGYNLWQMDFNRQSSLQQRGWTMQDWNYQDTMRGLSNQWGMEDINEQIRFSSGRQRRQLVRQRERMATTQNLEGEQVDRTRERQEEVWKQEDERYEKYREYMLELQRIDKEGFDLSRRSREENYRTEREELARKKKEWEEQNKLEDEIRTLSRKFQYDQLQLQKEAAGIQAAAAKAQKDINDAIAKSQPTVEEWTGELENFVKYGDPAQRILQAMSVMLKTAGGVDPAKANAVRDMLVKLSGISPQNMRLLIALLEKVD